MWKEAHQRVKLQKNHKIKKVSLQNRISKVFSTSKINFQATDYYQIINWSTTALTLPVLLRRASDDEVSAKIIAGKTAEEWNFGKIPRHTQAVKRCAKLITEASKNVVGTKNQDGFIRSTLE